MRIEFSQSGGIVHAPGLQRPVAIDADGLPADQREALERLVDAARFFELPAKVGVAAQGAADCQYHTLCIERGGRRHTVQALVPAEDEGLRALIDEVRRHVKAARRRARNPGAGGAS